MNESAVRDEFKQPWTFFADEREMGLVGNSGLCRETLKCQNVHAAVVLVELCDDLLRAACSSRTQRSLKPAVSSSGCRPDRAGNSRSTVSTSGGAASTRPGGGCARLC
jgi:hypothetical protein